MSHTPVPEKIDIIEKSTTVVFNNGFENDATGEYVDVERGLIHLNDQINELIDWANSIEKRMGEQQSGVYTVDGIPPEKMKEAISLIMGEQPSEVVRPIDSYVNYAHGEWRTIAFYPTREAAETARKMLLGNVE